MLFDDPRGLATPSIRDRGEDGVGLLPEAGLVEDAAVRGNGVRRHLECKRCTVSSYDKRHEHRWRVALRSRGSPCEGRTKDPVEIGRGGEHMRGEAVRH